MKGFGLNLFAVAVGLGLNGNSGLANANAGPRHAAQASNASAQMKVDSQIEGGDGGILFVGEGNGGTPSSFLVDVGSGDSSPAFSGAQLSGAAHDFSQNRVYFVSGANLSEWAIGGALTPIGPIKDSETGLINLTMNGLALGNGTLYGCGGSGTYEAIYSISLAIPFLPRASLHIDLPEDEFDCGDLAFNPEDGALYMVNNDPTPLGRGLYRMNPDGSGTLIVSYPDGLIDISGLAIGSGRAYLVPTAPGNIYVYDFDSAAYQTPLPSPFTSATMVSSGATWITPDTIFTGEFE